MAVPFAVRRSGSLLLRALAVGGFATAAWFVCAGVAAAGGDHSDEVAKTPDLVNLALGEPSAGADLLAGAVPEDVAPCLEHHAAGQPFGLPLVEPSTFDVAAFEAATFDVAAFDVAGYAFEHSAVADQPFGAGYAPVQGMAAAVHEEASYADPDYAESTTHSYSGGYSHSAVAANTMPAPLYEAKVAAKAAARAATRVEVAAPEPAAVEVSTPPRTAASPFAVDVPSAPTAEVEVDASVTWEAPVPSAPAPAPKQAPSAPTASSSSSGADSGGGHRGGIIASFTGQSNPKPPTAWSTERRDDDRSPGSVQGLPSTSPD
ncbi:hypothetical protein [Saccharothrix sp. HUAS TT1]|uniref:hypothetical protein n=1 Tax=unclassified Saccharothrix TaxID=2593673 RepID=UPI00345B612B